MLSKEYSKITVVTVTYNAEEFLERTIKSILKQDYPKIEYIIIDGGSSDGTIDIIKKYQKSIDYWASEPDNGIYDAMNKGIDQASGEWINFMNAGDKFANETSVSHFINNVLSETDLYNGAIQYIDVNTGQFFHKSPHGLDKIWETVPCWHQASFIKTKIMKSYKYSIQYKIASDYEFYIQCYKDGRIFQFSNNVIACMISGGIHQRQKVLAHIEAMKILADHLKDPSAVLKSIFFKQLYSDRVIDDNLYFSKVFNVFYESVEIIKDKYEKIAIYGYGTIGKTICRLLDNNVEVIIDNDTSKHTLGEPSVYPLDVILTYDFDVILITVLGREDEIANVLKRQYKISDDKIISFEIK